MILNVNDDIGEGYTKHEGASSVTRTVISLRRVPQVTVYKLVEKRAIATPEMVPVEASIVIPPGSGGNIEKEHDCPTGDTRGNVDGRLR
jgi:hypothetical protein